MSGNITPEGNLATLLLQNASVQPDRLALWIPTAFDPAGVRAHEAITFGALEARVASFQAGLRQAGLEPGDRVVLMFPVSVDFYALAIALLAGGLTVVLVDTGMGARQVLNAIRCAKPRAIVSVHAILRHRFWLRALWGLRRFSVDSCGLGLRPFSVLRGPVSGPTGIVACGPDDHALVTFTSGSTGRPKGADRTHGLLIAQHRAMREAFPEQPDDVDMTCFPVVVLHNLACGVTSLLPPVDLRAPASAEPVLVLDQVDAHGVTRLNGAPAYLERLVAHMEATGRRAPSVRGIAVGGAPVPASLCGRIRRVFPGAKAFVVYGSTEAEPICVGAMAEADGAPDAGVLAGRPVASAAIELVSLPEQPPVLGAEGVAPYRVAPGQAGEVVVSGPHVVVRYFDDPAADRATKLFEPSGRIWHRTGDVGHFDTQGRLWLTGRTADWVDHQGRRLHPLVWETRLEALPGVRRAALVASRAEPEGAVVIEPVSGFDPSGVADRVRAALAGGGLGGLPVRLIGSIPVDRRHNSKIDRPALRRWLG